jgi:hypothetical protein
VSTLRHCPSSRAPFDGSMPRPPGSLS